MELFHRILVTSFKGGIGKSTVALGVAAALSGRGRRVLLIDCDAGNRCLDLMLGVENSVLYDWGDVLAGHCSPAQAFLSVPGAENLVFCAAPLSLPEDFSTEAFSAVLHELAEEARADFVICDTAGSGATVQAIASSFADGALVLSTQQPASVRAAERTAAAVQAWGKLPCRLVISAFEDGAAADGERAGLIDIIDGAHVQTIGVVVRDRTLMLDQEAGRLPRASSRAAASFANIAARLCGENVRLFSGIRRIRTRRVL